MERGRDHNTVIQLVSGDIFLQGTETSCWLPWRGSFLQTEEAKGNELCLNSVTSWTPDSFFYSDVTTVPVSFYRHFPVWLSWLAPHMQGHILPRMWSAMELLQAPGSAFFLSNADCPSRDPGCHHHAAHSQLTSWRFSLYILFSYWFWHD